MVGEHRGADGKRFSLQLTAEAPCCKDSKVVCLCEFETGVYTRLYLRCRPCSMQNEPHWSLGYDEAIDSPSLDPS